MSLQIKCRRCTIEDSLKAYVEKKSARLNRFFSKILKQEVVFTGEKFASSALSSSPRRLSR